MVVGDFESYEYLFEMVEEKFTTAIRNKIKIDSSSLVKIKPFKKVDPFFIKEKVDFDVPMLVLGYPVPASNSPESLSLDIVQTILTQGESSRLNKKLVRDKKLAVMAGGMNHILKRCGMSLFFSLYTPDASVSKIEKIMVHEIENSISTGITKDELVKVKNGALTKRTFERFSSENIANKLASSQVIDGDYRNWIDKMHFFEELTPEKIISDVNSFWISENRFTLSLTPKKINPLLFGFGLFRRIFLKGR